MNLNQLQYFVAVAEHQNFTKAATQHYISQTAITQQIHALEESLGVKLVDRSTRPITLTPAGQVFLMEARAILERMNQAVARTREAAAGPVGTLRIGYTKGYEYSNFSDHLRQFHQAFPNIHTPCYRCTTDLLAAGLLRGEYDVIFTWDSTDICREDWVDHHLVEEVRLMATLYKRHPYARRTSLTRADLKGEKLFFMSPSGDGDSLRDAHYIRLYQEAGYQPDIILRSSDMESVTMMVEAEMGISILPAYCANNRQAGDNLVFVPMVGEGEVEEIIAVWRKEDQNPALEQFLRHMFPEKQA